MTLDIAGAGIGGLTTAIALKQKGFKVRLFEQAEEIKPVGAGIILASNAMQIFKKLNLKEAIEQHGNPISSMNLTKPSLKVLSKVDLSHFEKKYRVKNIAIHRGKLQQLLLSELNPEEIHLGHQLNKVDASNNGYNLTFDNGRQVQSSLLIGADGLNSIVRKSLFPSATIRNAKQVCWRGVTDCKLPEEYAHELNEAWGKNGRFGFVQIAPDTVYWYALKSFKNDESEFDISALSSYFSNFHPMVERIIANTPKTQINTAIISDLKPTNVWFQENVCLLGDAAHAATPNMGQGACQAIEDAYALTECLSKYETNEAFHHYQKIRMSKAHRVVNASWKIGKLAHISNPLLVGLRDQLMRITPSSLGEKQTEQLFQIPTI